MSREGNLIGAERELLVSLDLMRRGFEVFRPMHATSCDILALKYGLTLRIEVKGTSKGFRNPSGPVSSLPTKNGSPPDCREFDILVRFQRDGEMTWQPSVHFSSNKAAAELPIRWEYSNYITKKNLSRAQKEKNDRCLTAETPGFIKSQSPAECHAGDA